VILLRGNRVLKFKFKIWFGIHYTSLSFIIFLFHFIFHLSEHKNCENINKIDKYKMKNNIIVNKYLEHFYWRIQL